MAARFLFAPAIAIAMLVMPRPLLQAGGPRTIAGTSYFDPAVKGTPLTWNQGAISYYTDRGNLSPALPSATADAFVADAFSRWTSISTAAVSATQAGQLAEDVSGDNVSVSGGTIVLPADIRPSANNFPVAIVYDADGSVTNALLGEGAGSAGSCFTNAAYGGVDSFSTDAHLSHALVILNGFCAQTSTQLPDMTYRLVRVLGRVLGLDWSQMNLNVFTHSPAPTSSDYAGLTIMHAVDPINCVPISICYPNADQPKMDDRAALSRLYPVTAQNQAAFPGKQLLSESTVRIHGSVYFADSNGQAAQPMQGVNVVARWIDPATGQPSRTYAAASVSGFLFRGNAGNAATGFYDSTGQAWDRFGSDDAAVEGFFDLGGLEIPNGTSSAQYQLSIEALDASWSQSIGPYAPWQVQPSGTFQPLIVTVSKGGDLQQDILMQTSAVQARDWFESTSFPAPASLPLSGDWLGTLSGLGNADYFWFVAQSDRTLSVEVTALDELKAASLVKAEPVIGMWALADPGTFPAPANTGLAFNSANFGMTRLDANLQSSTAFRLGIFDYRSDGRPDYRYHARVFYADNAVPARARVVLQAAVINISALLAPASYNTPKSVQATILGTASSLDISLLSSFAWIAQGATVDIALAARLLSNGLPLAATQVNYQVVKGSGTLSSASSTSDVNGFAGTTLHLAAMAGDVQVSACVAPANLPCQIFFATAVPPSMLRLEPVTGGVQVLPAGQHFQPVTVRVVDSAIAPHPVLGANVIFQVVVSRPATAPPPVSIGGIIIGKNPPPVIVSSSRSSVLSDGQGLSTLQPSAGAAQGALVIQGTAAAGANVLSFHLQSLLPVALSTTSGSSRPPLDSPVRNDRNTPAAFHGNLRMRQPQ